MPSHWERDRELWNPEMARVRLQKSGVSMRETHDRRRVALDKMKGQGWRSVPLFGQGRGPLRSRVVFARRVRSRRVLASCSVCS